MAILTPDQLKGKTITRLGNVATSSPAPTTPKSPGLLQNIANDFHTRVDSAANSQVDSTNHNQSLGSGILQTLGQGAGFVGDIGFDALKAVTPQPVKDAASSAVGAIASTGPAQHLESLVSTWAKAHPEAAKNLESIVNIASLIPAVKGAGVAEQGVKTAVEATTGAVKTGVSDLSKAVVPAAKTPIEDALKLTSPVLNKKGSISAFEKAGKPGGVTTKPGILQKIEYAPTKYDNEVANTTAPFISSAKNPAQNIHSIMKEVERFSKDEVTPFLEANPRAVNVNTVASRLRAVQTPDLFKTEPVLEKSYNLVRQKMINRVKESSGNTLGLWNARKKFDADVVKEFGDVAFDDAKYTPINRAISDMRKEMHSLIADQIGNDTFTKQIKKLSHLYEARTRIAEKSYKLLNSDKLKRLITSHPNVYRMIKWGIPGAGLVIGGLSAVD